MKAQVATIDLGFTQFDGLMLPDGQYAIAVPQAADLFERSRSVASRDFKRLLGARFESSKMTTEFNQAPVNVISISVFRLLVRELDKQGNQIATALVDAFFEESIERRFDTAFEKKVSETEYNQRLVLRMSRLMARHAWTDILRDRHIQIFGCVTSNFIVIFVVYTHINIEKIQNVHFFQNVYHHLIATTLVCCYNNQSNTFFQMDLHSF